MIAMSISELPIRSAREAIIEPLMIAATFVVPPPISTTADACSSLIGTPAPIAAACPSSIMYTRLMRASSAAAEMRKTAARCSDEVVEHRPRSFEVGDNSVNQGCDDSHIARLTSLHLVGFVADRDDFAGN